MESTLPVAALAAGLVLLYSLVARSLGRWNLTAPMAFVAAGYLLHLSADFTTASAEWLLPVAELTLALVLFHDAAAVRPSQMERDGGFVSRLLLIGLPLTIMAGYLLAVLLFPGIPWAAALLLGAMLAPTDAALGAATVSDKRIPVRVRRILNVESGLNDGLATPVVLFAIAALATIEDVDPRGSATEALIEIGVAVALGALVGFVGGQLIRISHHRNWSTGANLMVAGLALPLLCYYGAPLVDGNGFIATFVAGSFFGIALKQGVPEKVLALPEGLSLPLGDITWLTFGVLMVPQLLAGIGFAEVLYALAALTVLRMLPVWLSLLGSGLRVQTAAFIGWFGPRGLASVVFSLIALESLERNDTLRTVLGTATLTILLSVILHGISAGPGATKYSRWVNRAEPQVELVESREPALRGRMKHHRHTTHSEDSPAGSDSAAPQSDA
jgi:NhaP-type Na+/H+ or K+/H+ antiporter